MENKQNYVIHMAPEFEFLKLIDVPEIVNGCQEKWFNQTLCKVNDCLVRLGVFNEGEFHWHRHDDEDEFFFVLKGQLFVEIEGEKDVETVALSLHQGITVPKGVNHRTYVKEPTAALMVEGDSVTPTGDQ